MDEDEDYGYDSGQDDDSSGLQGGRAAHFNPRKVRKRFRCNKKSS